MDSPQKGIGAPRHEGAEAITISYCMCELLRTGQSAGDDTHAVVTRVKSVSGRGRRNAVVLFIGGG